MHSPISEDTCDVKVLSETPTSSSGRRTGMGEDGVGGGGTGKEPKADTCARGRGGEVTSAGKGGSKSGRDGERGLAGAAGGGRESSGSGWGWGGYDGYAALFGRGLDSGDGEQRQGVRACEGRSGGHAGRPGGGVVTVEDTIEISSSDDEVMVLGSD